MLEFKQRMKIDFPIDVRRKIIDLSKESKRSQNHVVVSAVENIPMFAHCAEQKKAMVDCSKMGSNLNQIARRINSNKIPDSIEIIEELIKIEKAVGQVKESLAKDPSSVLLRFYNPETTLGEKERAAVAIVEQAVSLLKKKQVSGCKLSITAHGNEIEIRLKS